MVLSNPCTRCIILFTVPVDINSKHTMLTMQEAKDTPRPELPTPEQTVEVRFEYIKCGK